MARFLKAVACIGVWLVVTLICGAVGAWWPIRNVEEPWAGDGIGMIMYGTMGLLIGAVVGVVAVFLFLAAIPRIRSRRVEQAVTCGEGVWPPPPNIPAAQPRAAEDAPRASSRP